MRARGYEAARRDRVFGDGMAAGGRDLAIWVGLERG